MYGFSYQTKTRVDDRRSYAENIFVVSNESDVNEYNEAVCLSSWQFNVAFHDMFVYFV